LEGRAYCLTEVLSLHLLGGTEENHENLRVAVVSAEIRTGNPPRMQVQSVTARLTSSVILISLWQFRIINHGISPIFRLL
jgi:hypothetical protein